ncbi:MAG: hypothetical protein P4L53_08980 [Candidatus Obscuribacterales bacterium]|nr:hypothetical protein [Candidatus Obscuribacterales bacterium]
MLVSSEACAQKHNQSAIVLEQDSLLLGPITVVVSALALKITAKRSGLVIVSKSPDWRVSGFNSRTKKIFTTSFKEYSAARANGTQSIFTAFHGFTLSDVPLEKCGPATFFNYAVQNFKASESFQRRMEQRRKTEKINGSTPENVNYQILNLPVYSAPECNILARTTGCAELSRIPLTLIYTGTDKKPHNWLVTTSIKKTQVTDKEFAIPNDYTAVKSEPMVNQTEATAEGVMDLFETGQHRLRDKLFIKE